MSTAFNSSCDRSRAYAIQGNETISNARFVLATTILASSLAYVDGSVVNVGLVAIGRSLAADASALQWVINAYLLPLSALLLLGGAAGDRFGRRRILMLGIWIFALGSTACALAPDFGILVSGRLLQGIGAAMLAPNSLAALGQSFSGAAKGRAVGIWAATGAIAGAIGPVLGGWLIDLGSWRAIFLINLPIAAAAILLAWRYMPGDPMPTDLGRRWSAPRRHRRCPCHGGARRAHNRTHVWIGRYGVDWPRDRSLIRRVRAVVDILAIREKSW